MRRCSKSTGKALDRERCAVYSDHNVHIGLRAEVTAASGTTCCFAKERDCGGSVGGRFRWETPSRPFAVV
jgi:hypothetical protein